MCTCAIEPGMTNRNAKNGCMAGGAREARRIVVAIMNCGTRSRIRKVRGTPDRRRFRSRPCVQVTGAAPCHGRNGFLLEFGDLVFIDLRPRHDILRRCCRLGAIIPDAGSGSRARSTGRRSGAHRRKGIKVSRFNPVTSGLPRSESHEGTAIAIALGSMRIPLTGTGPSGSGWPISGPETPLRSPGPYACRKGPARWSTSASPAVSTATRSA